MARQPSRLPQAGRLDCDVLVIGGGPAAAWAGLAAAEEGASVIVVDKGYLGTSGATAPSTTGVWYADTDADREAIVKKRTEKGLGLADPVRIGRVVETASLHIRGLADRGYAFPTDDAGRPYLANLRGPDYMHFMRRELLRRRVRIFDHHPALELLAAAGEVAGASGVDRQEGGHWEVRAGAVVLATGGCAFGDRILGTTGLSGDGLLMACEAGAALSGMEFSAQYGIAPLGSAINKGITFTYASFYDEAGREIPASVEDRYPVLAAAMRDGPVFARFDRMPQSLRAVFRKAQPNCFLPFDRMGIDPFTQVFPVRLLCEGTVRGTGGLRAAQQDCATDVPGLFAAGDVLDRQDLAGATTGGGGPNAAWAIATGVQAGKAAARHAQALGPNHGGRPGTALGEAGLRPRGGRRGPETAVLRAAMQEDMLPLERNFFRTRERLAASLERLDALWSEIRDGHGGEPARDPTAVLRRREAASMIFTGRAAYLSSLSRPERVGLNRRLDLDHRERVGPARTLARGSVLLSAGAAALSGLSFGRASRP